MLMRIGSRLCEEGIKKTTGGKRPLVGEVYAFMAGIGGMWRRIRELTSTV